MGSMCVLACDSLWRYSNRLTGGSAAQQTGFKAQRACRILGAKAWYRRGVAHAGRGYDMVAKVRLTVYRTAHARFSTISTKVGVQLASKYRYCYFTS